MDDIFTGKGAPLTPQGFAKAATDLNVTQSEQVLWTILAVETRGFGYLPDRRPKILFERHIFHNRTGGRFSSANPDISNPQPGGYAGGSAEYQRLKRAMLLDRKAALESASWGLGQVMGFNATSIGYASAEAMMSAFLDSEDEQLASCVAFIRRNPPLLTAVGKQDWKLVAFYYNGAAYTANNYDGKLQDAFASPSQPDLAVRSAQARLSYLKYDPHGIDGRWGKNTTNALKSFQVGYNKAKPASAQALPVDGLWPHAATDKALADAAKV